MAIQFNDNSTGKLFVRLTLGVLLLFHGVAKILHPEVLDYIGIMLSGVGLPSELAYGVYLGEVVAPLMIILGVYARVGGAIVAVNMIMAIVLSHMGDLFNLTTHGGWMLELQAFYLLGGLSIALLGSGRFAIKED